MIRVVTFDFWDTLVCDSAANLRAQRGLRIEAIRRALGQAGVPLTEAEAEEAHDRSGRLLEERFWNRHRDPGHEEQVRLVLESAAPGVTARMSRALFEEAVEAYISPVLSYPPALNPGVAEAVRGLAAGGVRLGIISNTGRTPGIVLRRVLERHGLLDFFGAVSYSDEVGVRKPDPEIFRVTLERAGSEPAEAAHVGDNPVADVQGARGIGMRAVHYVPGGRGPAADADLAVAHLAELPQRLFRIASRRGSG